MSVKRWKFAYEAIVNEEIRPHFDCYKWENIQAHLARCREYRAIHLQELTGKLSNEQKERAEVKFFDRTFRFSSFSSNRTKGIGEETRRVQSDVHSSQRGNRSEEEKRTGAEDVVGKRVELVGWKQKSGRSECVENCFDSSFDAFRSDLDLEKVMSPEEKQKLFEAIGYAGEDTSTMTYPEEVRAERRRTNNTSTLRRF